MAPATKTAGVTTQDAKVIAIQIVGTDPFWNNYSKQTPSNKMDDILNYTSNTWSEWTEDGSGQYDAGFTAQYQAGATIPGSALPDTNSLFDRLQAADNWLSNNESNLYSGADSIIVVDYYGNDPNTYGWAYIQTAGTDDNKCGLVDTQWEDTGSLPSELSNVKSEGVAIHECYHTFNARHPKDVTTFSTDDITLMYSWDGVDCNNDGSTNVVVDITSNCTDSDVRGYIDNNNLS